MGVGQVRTAVDSFEGLKQSLTAFVAFVALVRTAVDSFEGLKQKTKG